MATIANLGIAGASLATAGGLIGGGYFMLKNDPKPVTQLLEIRKRQLLEKGKDDEAFKQKWQSYIDFHTETIPDDSEPTSPEPKKPKPPVTKTKKVIKETDIWNLANWTADKSKSETVPESFKEACVTKSKENQNGIWTDAYKKFEQFCTKEAPSDDE